MSRRHRRSIALYVLVLAALALVAWAKVGVAHADDTVIMGALPSVGAVSAAPTTPAPDASGRFRTEWRSYLAAERLTNIARLRAYQQRGVFPLNETQEGYLDIFVDSHGTRCAMANLIALSGQAALVAQVAQEDNTRQLAAVTEGPLLEWMLTSGLTQDEAAFVQEPDFFMEPEASPAEKRRLLRVERERLRTHFAEAEAHLVRDTAESLELALDRLGARLDTPPPARAARALPSSALAAS